MATDTGRWKRVREVFQATLDRPESERAHFVREACGDDSDLRLDVESLLEAHAAAPGHFMQSPVQQLAPGVRIGTYEILGRLGEGGMGVVYRARDERLGRDVAIKVLPHVWLTDLTRRARFEREARLLAALNHPHIGAIYGIEDSLGVPALILELVEGSTLAERIAQGELSLDQSLAIAEQIAEALEAAHRRGIIHRDLKPANVKTRTDGTVKVLDFGVAKPITAEVDVGVSEMTDGAVSGSRESLTAGTPAYMSPEQAQGQAVDQRADIWAFGCVMYEMLTGRRAFVGDGPSDTIAAVVRDEIEWTRLPSNTPASIQNLLRRCLARNRDDRLGDIALARREIAAVRSQRTRVNGKLAWGVAVACLLAIGVIGIALMARYRALASSNRLPPLVLGNARQLTAEEGLQINPAFSPDARFIAYSAGTATEWRMMVRPVGEGAAVPLVESTDAFQLRPRWSPDGTTILYVAEAGVFIVPARGGPARALRFTPAPGSFSIIGRTSSAITDAVWSPDGRRIAVASGGDLWTMSADGSDQQLVAHMSFELHSCDWSPARDWIACTSGNWTASKGTLGNLAPSTIALIPARGGVPQEITDRNATNRSPVWSRTGSRLYFVSNRQGTSDIYAIDISPQGRVRGDPVRITTGLGAISISFTPDRTRLAYATSFARANIWTLPIPSHGSVDSSGARSITSGNQVVESMSVSLDGKWLLYDSNLPGRSDIYRVPIDGGAPERLTTDAADNFAPDLSLDGRWLTYHSWRTGSRDIFVKQLPDGQPEQVTNTPSQESYPAWSPDGNTIAFYDQFAERGVARGTFFVHRQPSGQWGVPVLFAAGGWPAHWSPDGRVLARSVKGVIETISVETRAHRIIYRPREGTDDPIAASVRFAEDSTTIYFKSHDPQGRGRIWSLPISGSPRLMVRFDDLGRPSARADFAVGGGRLFFAIDDRQSNIWIADVTER